MFAGIHENSIILRLSKSDLQRIFAQHEEVKTFAPMGGHVMKEYAAIPKNLALKTDVLGDWLDKSYEYVSLLPLKIAKKSRKKKYRVEAK